MRRRVESDDEGSHEGEGDSDSYDDFVIEDGRIIRGAEDTVEIRSEPEDSQSEPLSVTPTPPPFTEKEETPKKKDLYIPTVGLLSGDPSYSRGRRGRGGRGGRGRGGGEGTGRNPPRTAPASQAVSPGPRGDSANGETARGKKSRSRNRRKKKAAPATEPGDIRIAKNSPLPPSHPSPKLPMPSVPFQSPLAIASEWSPTPITKAASDARAHAAANIWTTDQHKFSLPRVGIDIGTNSDGGPRLGGPRRYTEMKAATASPPPVLVDPFSVPSDPFMSYDWAAPLSSPSFNAAAPEFIPGVTPKEARPKFVPRPPTEVELAAEKRQAKR